MLQQENEKLKAENEKIKSIINEEKNKIIGKIIEIQVKKIQILMQIKIY